MTAWPSASTSGDGGTMSGTWDNPDTGGVRGAHTIVGILERQTFHRGTPRRSDAAM